MLETTKKGATEGDLHVPKSCQAGEKISSGGKSDQGVICRGRGRKCR